MPSCAICHASFSGRGNHCAQHSSGYMYNVQDPYNNYNSDSTEQSAARIRTSQRNRSRNIRFATANAHNTRNNYNESGGIVRYDNGISSANSAFAQQALVHTFNRLSHAHAISSLTYTVSPHGEHALRAEANFDREQCSACRKWFPDFQKLEHHQVELPVACEEHGTCMRLDDVQWHATQERHNRCFVRGCQSLCRKEGDWRSGDVKAHVKQWHCQRGEGAWEH